MNLKQAAYKALGLTLILVLSLSALALLICLIRASGLNPTTQLQPFGESQYQPMGQYKSLTQDESLSQYARTNIDGQNAARRLSGAIRYRTLSPQNPNNSENTTLDQFRGLHAYLQGSYPAFHAIAKRQIINQGSLVYHWPGSDTTKQPMLWLAHLDVVPAPNSKAWLFPPFSGKISEAGVWGRGTLDNKVNVIAMLDALEHLARSGFKPSRSLYLAFGHDEESGGQQGAKAISQGFQQQGLRFAYILDEGGFVTERFIDGLEQPVAIIGHGEKGYLSLSLSARDKGGHSSMPTHSGAIQRLAAAIERLSSHPFPVDTLLFNQFLDALSPSLPFNSRLILSNRWLFQSWINQHFEQEASMNALMRTTQAFTAFHAGNSDNVLPRQAQATLNLRILPGESIQSSLNRVTDIINDKGIKISVLGQSSEPSALSPIDSDSYQLISNTIKATYHSSGSEQGGEVVVAPRLVVAATDARHYDALSEHIYRFSYLPLSPETLNSLHGVDEHITIPALVDAITFYHKLAVSSQ
jgi:carboxypeptidase PM20D1